MKALPYLLACATACAAMASTGSFAAAEAPTLRLPTDARPVRYALTLDIDPGQPRAAGEISIEFDSDVRRDVLWLNADGIEISRATVDAGSRPVSVIQGNDQFVGFGFDPPLDAGRHTLTVSFSAEQSRATTRGIFALQETGEWYAMTQFEATSARRAFPCFDEPGFKTPWQVTLRVPRDSVALSNTSVASETISEDGTKIVRFMPTRPLPSYLVVFAIGPWQTVELGRMGANGTPTRIVVPRGRVTDTAFVSKSYPELFDRLETWFGIPYPYDKLDHIAIPITVSFAMENAGLITYGANTLLAKPDALTPRYRRIAASVGAHEISHQWFGDLVTMAWWDDIWLNEAFATWIAEKIVGQWQPDYEHGAARIRERADAIDADGLSSARQIRQPIASRGDIFSAFDPITYEKGATVIAMFEQWLGEDVFRRGVREYLVSRSDGSATASDFLSSLQAVAGGKPVAPAFETFLNQNGVPRVGVRSSCGPDGASVTLSQSRLSLLGAVPSPAQTWQIPVCLRYGEARASRETCTLLTEPLATVKLDAACPAFVFANARGRGYYVADYDVALRKQLARRRDALSVAEYASWLYDLRALIRSGSVSLDEAKTWITYGAMARDRHVVLAALDLAEFVGETLVADGARPGFELFVRKILGPRARSLGFAPRAGEGDDDQLMRRDVLRLVAPMDPALAAKARNLAYAWLRDRRAVDPGMVEVVLMTAARGGEATLFDAMLAEARSTKEGLDRRNLTMALFSFGDPALAKRGLSLLLDPLFDIRESFTALRFAYPWNPTRRAPHDFIMANFDALIARVGRDNGGYWPYYASGLCSEQDRAAVNTFWTPKSASMPGAAHQLALSEEAIGLCARLRQGQRTQSQLSAPPV